MRSARAGGQLFCDLPVDEQRELDVEDTGQHDCFYDGV